MALATGCQATVPLNYHQPDFTQPHISPHNGFSIDIEWDFASQLLVCLTSDAKERVAFSNLWHFKVDTYLTSFTEI